MDSKSQKAKNTGRVQAFSGKWLRFLLADYQNKEVTVKGYEYVERTTRKGEFDGITIIGIVKYPNTNRKDKLILIGNYRPPIDKYVIEFPAGLVDSADDCFTDAVRELKEETGFVPEKILNIIDSKKIPQVSPIVYSEPSVTNENEKIIILQIDGENELNKNTKQELEETENINVHLVDLDEKLLESISKLAKENDYVIETKVYTFALGISLGKVLV